MFILMYVYALVRLHFVIGMSLCFVGAYSIILDESHFKDLLNSHALPQASAVSDSLKELLTVSQI